MRFLMEKLKVNDGKLEDDLFLEFIKFLAMK